ncbi:acyl-CoA N-acyltransferase [Rhizodiscina lignyota]|uniref:Acyl-CoA N-acyltransferase n=1 Tax=Rhizodiscina lignyota TaxID=1504668 RepID=A0A9P4I400_9PEZI|nr:acyl-CoA N-acyltransferase [Rhizodiscina lignyota]
MADQPQIRLATRRDIPEILAMIRELATYEHALDSVKATEALLSQTLTFAPSPADATADTSSKPQTFASTFILTAPAEDGQKEGSVAGMALFYHTYSTWLARPGIYLEDLFVRPAYRRRGYATLLLKELAKETQRINGGRLEWSCLRWNESALKFYRGLGAEEMEEWVGLRVDGERLGKLSELEVDTKGS